MARNNYTPEQLEAIGKELQEAVTSLSSLAQSMRDAGLPSALLHAATTENFHIPAVMDWVGKVNVDVKTQIRAFSAGVQSRAELHKRYNANQKLAAAKRPAKKAVKKKAT